VKWLETKNLMNASSLLSPPVVDQYFDFAEHVALRSALLYFLVLAFWRVIEREWKTTRGGRGDR
jgi:hypothetical protein